jgi:urea carboxylase
MAAASVASIRFAAQVADGKFAPRMRNVTFSLGEFQKDTAGYNHKLEGVLNGN